MKDRIYKPFILSAPMNEREDKSVGASAKKSEIGKK